MLFFLSAFAGTFDGLGAVTFSDETPPEQRAFRDVMRQIPEASRPPHEAMIAWAHRPDLLEAAPDAMWVWTTKDLRGIPAGTPVLVVERVPRRFSIVLDPVGNRINAAPNELALAKPATVAFPAYVAIEPANANGMRVRPYAELVPALSSALATFDGERERLTTCALKVKEARAGTEVDPSRWNVVTYDRDGNVTSMKRWSEVIGDEVAKTCDPERLERADATFTAAVLAIYNAHMARALASVKTRLGA